MRPGAPGYTLGERYEVPGRGVTLRIERLDTLEEGEAGSILDLLTRSFNGGPSWFALPVEAREHLEWKATGPVAPAQISLTEDGDRLVGSLMHLRRRYHLRGEEVRVGESVDAALDPEYQGRGLTYPQEDLRSELGIASDCFCSVSYSTHPVSRTRRGVPQDHTMVAANQVDTLLRPLSMRSLIDVGRRRAAPEPVGQSRTRAVMEAAGGRPQQSRAGRAVLGARLAMSALRPWSAPRNSSVTIRTASQFDERADELWGRASGAFDLIQVRDRAYLNWRYCDPRGGAYMVRVAEAKGALLGYAVLRQGGRGAVLDDLLAIEGRPDVVRALVGDALDAARGMGAAFVRSWLPHRHPYRAQLDALGFVRYPGIVRLACRRRQCSIVDLAFLGSSEARLHVMSGDTDHL